MKKTNNYIKQGMIVLFTAALMFGAANKTVAQTCNQVEITYKEPDCYKSKGTDGAIGPGQGRSCTPVTVCVNQLYTYSAGPGWASYLWVITGPAIPPINPNATSPNVTINWPLVGTYILTLTVTDAGGNIFTKCLEITVKEKPVANFTFNFNNACVGSTVNFINGTTFSGTPSYSWNFGDPTSPNNTSLLSDPSHIFSGVGTYVVTLIAYSSMLVPGGGNGQHGDSLSLVTCCADTIKKTVTVATGNVKIECISTVCAGAKSTYTAVGCGSPTWGPIIGGSLQSTSGNTITVLWGNGNPQGQLSVSCGGCTAYVTVPIVPSTPIITGTTSPCNPGANSYSVPYLPGTEYTWTLMNTTTATNANALLSTYPDNNTVWINWPATTDTYQLTISLNNKHLCCTSTNTITITPKGKFTVSGPSTICQNQSGTFSTVPSGSFSWQIVPGGGVSPATGTGPSHTASFANIGSYIITATDLGSAFCNLQASASISVVPVPVPCSIQGPLVACVGGNYAYSMSCGAPPNYYYEWTITGGTFQPGALTTTTGDNVTVQWASLPGGTITVSLKQSTSPFCNIPAGSITVGKAVPGTIGGPQSICVDGTSTYTLSGTLPAGTTVTWSVSPGALGTIISGQGTIGPITVLWHGQGGAGPWGPATVSASTGCGPATPLGSIMIYPKFTFTVSAAGTNVCLGPMTLTANGAPMGTTFNWAPGGPGQSITVNAPGTYICTGTNGGCSFSVPFDVPDPFAIIPVTCGVGHCNLGVINEQLGVSVIKPGSGTFTYEWHSGTCASPGPILQTTTNGLLSDNYLATLPGPYCVFVKYGNCTKCIDFVVKKICCPDVNNPQITITKQLTCDTWTFTGTTPNPTGAAITWYFGDNTQAVGASGVPVTHTYMSAGIYCVTFCVGPPNPNPTSCTGNCAVTQAIVPIAAAFNYTLGCNGCLNVINQSSVFGNPAYVTYAWNFGDPGSGPLNTSALQSPPQHCFSSPGTFTVTLTVTYNDGNGITCTKTATHTIVYTPLAIAISGPVCSGQPVTFSSTPGGFLTYAWDFGDTYTAYTSPIVHIYSAPGIYTVNLSLTDLLGNTCTATRKDTVLTGISSCTILPGYLCPGQPATLLGPVGPYTYLWEVEGPPNTFTAAPGVNNTANYTTLVPGFYHVVVTNANGCSCISNTVEIKTVPKPKATMNISPSKNLCAPGGMVTITGPMVTGYTYAWLNNGNPAGGGPILMAFISSTSVITLMVTNQYGCSDTCVQTITVNPLPVKPTITGTGQCAGVPITLTVTNYANNITWNNGANTISIVVYSAGTYVATYTDPVTGCSSSEKYTVNRRPSAGLFPHFCDSIPCNCTRPFVIYAPNPLIGMFASNYNINWYNANTNVLLGSGPSYNNGGLGVQTGSYYIIITDQTTSCKDTSNNYSIVVPKCDTCDCKESKWGDIFLTEKNKEGKANAGNPIKIFCGKPLTLDCNKTYTIDGSYICKDTACNGKLTYKLQPPTGLPLTGTAPLTFTPNLNGVYILTLYGWCGGKICDSCVIDIIVKCDSCDCKGSKWGKITLSKGIPENPNGLVGGNGNPVIDPAALNLSCNKTYKIDCNKPYSFNANYICKDSACNGKVTYSLQPPVGVAITGNVAGSFTPTQTGIYTLTLYGWCGGKICDSCVIKFDVKCDPCDCKESKWGKITLAAGNPDNPNPVASGNPKVVIDPVAITLGCNKSYKLDCNKPYSVNASYICKDPNCPGKVTYSLQPPSGAAITGNMALNFTPVLNGTYTLTLYGWCGNTICDSCVIKFDVTCVEGCDCKGSHWGEIMLNTGGATQVANCGKTYDLKCKTPFTVNANYICADPACPGSVTYKFTPAVGAPISGNVPFTYMPTQSGLYTLVLYGWCGNKICDSCVIRFKVDDCPPPECCIYTITVKEPTVQLSTISNPDATVANGNFSITGPAGNLFTEIRAEVVSYNLFSNFNNECLSCKSYPFTWASIYQAGAIGAMQPKITMYNSTASIFNPSGNGMYQNPREVIWSGPPFAIPGNINMQFLLPPASVIDCCELSARVCVKFTFRGRDCRECEALVCFTVVIKKK